MGIINYCNHGEETGWQSHNYMNSNVNALTNNNKLPFIFSVACLVGKYDYSSGDCFAETWMHATNSNNPTGAIGGAFSYISQPWIPPMWAQDEFVDIIVESYSSNIKHSLGGAAINGMLSIFDHYSTTETSAVGTYKAWVVYGDPTLMLRTKTPQAMTVTHVGTIKTNATTYTVNVTNGNGSIATITDANHNILGKSTVSNNTATITINGTLTAGQTLTLCVFGYNKVTNIQNITVVNPATAPTVTTTAVSEIDKTTATGGGNVTADGGASVTARGICWSTSQNPTVGGSHTTDGTGTGSFTSAMTGLTANTIYYVRAYATNEAGTAYGEEVNFTTLPDGVPGDINGNGTLQMFDATLLLRHCMGGDQLNGQSLINADLNGDGKVNMYDATLLLRELMTNK